MLERSEIRHAVAELYRCDANGMKSLADTETALMPRIHKASGSKVSAAELTNEIEYTLLNSIIRTKSYVSVITDMLRREWYPTGQTFAHWKQNQLTFLFHILDQVQLVAYSAERLTPEMLYFEAGAWHAMNPLDEGQQNDVERLISPFSHTVALKGLVREMHKILRVEFAPWCDVSTVVADQFQSLLLKLNELSFLLTSWIQVLKERDPQRGMAVRFPYCEDRTRDPFQFLRLAYALMVQRPDIITCCLNARTAASAVYYALAMDFSGDPARGREWLGEAVKLHEHALSHCHNIPKYQQSTLLYELAVQSITWRRDLLKDSLSSYLEDFPITEGVPEETLQCRYFIDPDWLCDVEQVRLCIAGEGLQYKERQEIRLLVSQKFSDSFVLADFSNASELKYGVKITIREGVEKTCPVWDKENHVISTEVPHVDSIDAILIRLLGLKAIECDCSSMQVEELLKGFWEQVEEHRKDSVVCYLQTTMYLDQLYKLQDISQPYDSTEQEFLRLINSLDSSGARHEVTLNLAAKGKAFRNDTVPHGCVKASRRIGDEDASKFARVLDLYRESEEVRVSNVGLTDFTFDESFKTLKIKESI